MLHDRKSHNQEVNEQEYLNAEFKETSLLLALWSILVMNEGAIRFISQGQPGGPGLFQGNPMRFPTAFLAALFEVVFGLFGLFVGVAGGVLNVFNKKLHYALLVVQTILGWYTFIVYVFLLPSFRIASKKPQLTLSASESRAVGILGILTSLCWWLALQGGQFVFICRSLAFATDNDFLAQRRGAKMRAIFWNLNYSFAGLFAFITSAIVIHETRQVRVTGRFFAPPNVGRIPILLLFTSLLMMLWPLVGIVLVLLRQVYAMHKYALCSFFVFIIVYANYTLIQFGFLSGNPAPPLNVSNGAGMHNHLTMMLAFLGPYFMTKYAKESARSNPPR